MSYTKDIIDDMSDFFGEGHIHEPFVNRLELCYSKWDDEKLAAASDAQWKGLVTYYQQPNQADLWIDCLAMPNHPRCKEAIWLEGRKPAGKGLFGQGTDREMLALEKCNYVSNIAYLHSAMGVCDHPDWAADVSYRRALKQALMTLGSGSGFMHASHTDLGGLYDCNMMSVVAYVAYQSFISKLDTQDPILLGLSEEPQLDSREVAERIATLPLTN